MFSKSKFQRIIMVFVVSTMVLSGIQPWVVSAQSGDGLQRQVNAESGKVSFIGPESGRVVSVSKALGTSLRPEDPALALAKRYAPEFGIQNPERDLTEMKQNKSADGRVTARYQQNHQGIPVLGGELIVNTNNNGDLYSINGEVSPNLSLPTQPTIDSAQATQTALQALAKWYQKTPADFVASKPELWIFDESLLQPSTRPAELVWRMEVTATDASMPVRELVLVNAQRGGISLHFNQIDNAWGETQEEKTSQSFNTSPVDVSSNNQKSSGEPATVKTVAEYMPALSGGTIWYVATTGNDTNDCASPSTPCATINWAMGKVVDGDTIYVASGLYQGSAAIMTLQKVLLS